MRACIRGEWLTMSSAGEGRQNRSPASRVTPAALRLSYVRPGGGRHPADAHGSVRGMTIARQVNQEAEKPPVRQRSMGPLPRGPLRSQSIEIEFIEHIFEKAPPAGFEPALTAPERVAVHAADLGKHPGA